MDPDDDPEASHQLEQRVFTAFDLDGDDHLTRAELGKALRRLDKNISEADLTAVLSTVTHPTYTACGRVCREHYHDVLSYLAGKGTNAVVDLSWPVVERALRAFDFARGGTINMKFLLSVLTQTNGPDKLSSEEAADLFSLVDGDPEAVPVAELMEIWFDKRQFDDEEVGCSQWWWWWGVGGWLCPSVCLLVRLSVCVTGGLLSICLSVCLSVCLSICLSVYLSLRLSVSPSFCLSVCLSLV